MELKTTNHVYYCECWESNRTSEYDSWQDFIEDGEYDFDYNLPFRFDIENMLDDEGEDIKNKYMLKLHHALPRHGRDQWHVVVYNLKESDMAEVEEHLKKCKEYLFDLWKEIDINKENKNEVENKEGAELS